MSHPAEHDVAINLESRVGRVLRVGVVASSIGLGVGLAVALLGGGARFSRPLLTTGLIALLATPASRVVVSAVTYARSRDWLFLALTLVVLLELALSVIAAMRGAAG